MFTSAKFIIRLDDATPTMHHQKWSSVETLLDEFSIKPIVAVVPENRDSTLFLAEADGGFWSRVKKWEEKGWAIALHGCNHTYHEINKSDSLNPMHPRSEFAGLSLAQQERKIALGVRKFKDKGINAEIFVAPSHTFDRNTLVALQNHSTIRTISDCIAIKPYRSSGFIFLPQQLWHFKWRLIGTWTVCLHPNSMRREELDQLRKALSSGRYNIVGIEEMALADAKNFGLLDFLYREFYWIFDRVKSDIKHLLKKLKSG